MVEESIEKKKTKEEDPDPDGRWCPACIKIGKQVKLKPVEGIVQLAENPAQLDGAPRVIECEQGCRFTLEPYWGRKKKVQFCYICILSETNPAATCNHHF